ncbi:MAG: hypothetical protein ACLRT5_19765 [Lachnospiraceae bacterium]
MTIYVQILDTGEPGEKVLHDRTDVSLFDLVDEEQKKEFDIRLPDVGEYDKETKLAFEKEVIGVYLSRPSPGRLRGEAGRKISPQ